MDKYLRLRSQQIRSETHYKVSRAARRRHSISAAFEPNHSIFSCPLQDVRLSVDLLDRFVQGESLNQVVITLYPEDQGYTLALKIHNKLEGETGHIPYEEEELLNCIDNQQLPPVLVELLEEVGAQVFYDGCVFAEIKDLRESSKPSWNVLLKPNAQVLLKHPLHF